MSQAFLDTQQPTGDVLKHSLVSSFLRIPPGRLKLFAPKQAIGPFIAIEKVMPMKMSELRLENESLKQQIQQLSQQKAAENDSTITELKDKNRLLRKSVKELKAEKNSLTTRIRAQEAAQSAKEQEYQELTAELAHTQQQLAEISDAHAKASREVKSLRAGQKNLTEKAARIPVMQAELERLQQLEDLCNEKTAQVTALQGELVQCHQLLEESRTAASQALAEHEQEKARLTDETETVRTNLLVELGNQREQSQAQIASLQAQNNGLSSKVTELTEKLRLVATHLERQISERRKITSQYDTGLKEYQSYREKSEKQIRDLMSLLNKMAAELDASRSASVAQDKKPPADAPDHPGDSPTAPTQPTRQVQELQERLAELDRINADQAHQLLSITNRMKRVDRAFATPLGRVLAQVLGVKE
jgi:chromosome segregation ATPase